MMKRLYSVQDTLVGSYGAPFVSHNDATAKRDLGHAAVDLNSAIGRSPETYALFRLCEYDDEHAKFINAQEPPQFLCLASDLLPKE